MKRVSLFFLLLVSVILNAQIVNIPDSNFKNALVNENVAEIGNSMLEDVDTNNDGEIQVSEAEAVLILAVNNFEIGSLEGIQSFINVTHLQCTSNNLTSIDLSQNTLLDTLYCGDNKLTSLDVSQNTLLETIDCAENLIGSLDFSQNPNLVWIQAVYNQLTSIDVSQNLLLETLLCNTNLLTSIDTSTNAALVQYQIGENFLTDIDVSLNPNLEILICSGNMIVNLDLTQNTNLLQLNCSHNELTDLDTSQNPNLLSINCRFNNISNLGLSQNQNLVGLHCNDNTILNLDVSTNTNLSVLNCNSNNLESLNIQNGANASLDILDATDSPNLLCIQVDDVDYANNNPNWEKDITTIYSEDCSLGIDEVNLESSVIIYPNPVKDILTIQYHSLTAVHSLQLYDLLGKLVLTKIKEINNLDVTGLKRGVFLLKIETDKKVVVKKLTKE